MNEADMLPVILDLVDRRIEEVKQEIHEAIIKLFAAAAR